MLSTDDQDMLNDEFIISQQGKKWSFAHESKPNQLLSPTYVVKDAVVKFAPGKYAKMTVSLLGDSLEFFTDMFMKIIKEVAIENFVRDNNISIKLTPEQREEMKHLKPRDVIDIVITLTGVFEVVGKRYVCFALEDYRVSKTKKKYFAD